MITKRDATQIRRGAWPFLYSAVPGRGVVKNIPMPQKKRVRVLKPRVRLLPRIKKWILQEIKNAAADGVWAGSKVKRRPIKHTFPEDSPEARW